MTRVHINPGSLGEWARENYLKFDIASVQDDLERREEAEEVRAYFREFHNIWAKTREECRETGDEEMFNMALKKGVSVAEDAVKGVIVDDCRRRFEKYQAVMEKMLLMRDRDGNRMQKNMRMLSGAIYCIASENDEERVLRSEEDILNCNGTFEWAGKFGKHVLMPIFCLKPEPWKSCLLTGLGDEERKSGVLHELNVTLTYLKTAWVECHSMK